MRLGLIVVFVALLLATIAGQNTLLKPMEARGTTSAIAACTAQEVGCTQPSLDSSPGPVVLGHLILSEGCYRSDLHVVLYVPADSADGEPIAAKWCS